MNSKNSSVHCGFSYFQSKKKPIEVAEELEADQYHGFNLILVDLCSKSMLHVTNKPKENGNFVTVVSPGIHMLSNASPDSPWLKVKRLQRLDHNFKVMARYGKRRTSPCISMTTGAFWLQKPVSVVCEIKWGVCFYERYLGKHLWKFTERTYSRKS
ncbi:uncharacterized protein LOC111309141 isoform X2 [Durio zibethinus]|uniref:Uncharacterized protein LOC111309141 isoform X2 n=1 Tax=Durio zibethinus TaxID=66656 RepID=A0A6P6AFY6_DURZI|nr:uncharacterized protein LOC111309141 isoform X2 [Durio zibethinus]